MSKDCGLSEAAEKLNGAIDGAKAAADELISDATEGIAGAITGLADKITGQTDGIKADLEAMVPEIPKPEASLQDMMTGMLSTNDPGEMMSQYSEMKEKFGNVPFLDLDEKMSEFGLDPEKLNAGLDDYKGKLDAGNKIKDKAGGLLDKVSSVADSDLFKLASGDLSAIGKLADGFAGFIMGDEDKTSLLEKVCTKLANIKKQPPQDYVIQKGDTLTSIAKAHGTTVEELVELNDIKDPDKIFAGDTIKVPGKVVEEGPEAKVPTEEATDTEETPEEQPQGKENVTPEVEATDTKNADALVVQHDPDGITNFDFGPLVRNDALDTEEYQNDLKKLREIVEERNKYAADDKLRWKAWELFVLETRGQTFEQRANYKFDTSTRGGELAQAELKKQYDEIINKDPNLEPKLNTSQTEIEDLYITGKNKLIDPDTPSGVALEDNALFDWPYDQYFENYIQAADELIAYYIRNMSIKYAKQEQKDEDVVLIEFTIGWPDENTYTQIIEEPAKKQYYPYRLYQTYFLNSYGYGNYPIEQLRIWFKELTTEDNFIILGKEYK